VQLDPFREIVGANFVNVEWGWEIKNGENLVSGGGERVSS